MSFGFWFLVVLIEQNLGSKVARLNQSHPISKRNQFSKSKFVPKIWFVVGVHLNAD